MSTDRAGEVRAHARGLWQCDGKWDTTTINGHTHSYLEVLAADVGACVVLLPSEDDSPAIRREREATAQRIVLCVNTHDELVAAVERLIACHDAALVAVAQGTFKGEVKPCQCGACVQGREAVAKVRGGTS
jgi:hypothetical protein